MSNVHFRRNLIHICDTQRDTQSRGPDGEVLHSYATNLTSVRCRYVQKQERIAVESVGFQMQQVDLLLFEDGTDIVETDRVSNIRFYSDSSVVDAGPFTVESLLDRNSTKSFHISVQLERIE